MNNSATQLKTVMVVKRNGSLSPFRKERVIKALTGAFKEVNDGQADEKIINQIADKVFSSCDKQTISVETIQDLAEQSLMEAKLFDVAKAYIVYRDRHKRTREENLEHVKVIRRDGSEARFNMFKITLAIRKAFTNVLKNSDESSIEPKIEEINAVTQAVIESISQKLTEENKVHIEEIQDLVEESLMKLGYFKIAKAYILYREARAQERQTENPVSNILPIRTEGPTASKEDSFEALDNGSSIIITKKQLMSRLKHATTDLKVDIDAMYKETIKAFYPRIKLEEVDKALIFAARSQVEKDPQYSYVAARLLLDVLYREAIGVDSSAPNFDAKYRDAFPANIKLGIENERLSEELLKFDLERLAKAIDKDRDLKFQYLGAQTLYDRYLIHIKERRFETPQYFWMRVAMGLAIKEKDFNARAIEFYEVISNFHFVSSTPTLFNAGTKFPQLSSCYLTTVMDDLSHIFKSISDDAKLSKWAGGLGNDWTNVRATGARIKGTNGRSQGVIPFLKVANDTAVAVNQGGKRKGAMCAYLETWHLDVEDFLELRKNTGDERRRTHDMNTANWIPDLFMERVQNDEDWTLFSPDDTKDLHDLYGEAFRIRYENYEKEAAAGNLKLFKTIKAVDLWRKMLGMLFETGHPWITFKDPSNLRSPQDHVGVVHSSNLCTEILLNTSSEEVAVCNLGSVNMAAHTTAKGLDVKLLEKTIKTAIRMLDNVIDINFYPIEEAKNSNLRHRPIGLGIMGFQDSLYEQRIPYASEKAAQFADISMETISYYALKASCELAEERGAYSSFKGSKWSKGILPINSLKLLVKERTSRAKGDPKACIDVDTTETLDWETLRKKIVKHGLRNSNSMAIAPTATLSIIVGVTQSIEPTFKHLYAKSNLSGEFVVHNQYLVDDLIKLGIWDQEMIDDLKYFDGSLAEIERIPDDLKQLYLTAFEIEPEWLIECASRRQKWIDMGQSLNLYIAEPNGKKLNAMYMLAWAKGLKTTYYLRSTGATQIEKSTTDINKRGLQPRWMKNKSASSNVVVKRENQPQTEVKVCNIGDEICESCQ